MIQYLFLSVLLARRLVLASGLFSLYPCAIAIQHIA